MEINGKVIKVLPLQSGVSKAGKNWSKQEFLIETFDAYPKNVLCSIFNPGQNVAVPNVGEQITASIDIESRPFVGKDGVERFSTDIRAWKLTPYDPSVNVPSFAPQQPTPQPQAQPQQQWVGNQQSGTYPTQPQYQQAAPQFAPPQQPQFQQQPAPSNDGLPF